MRPGRQFLDIGTGLPAAGNTHEVAQSAAPECRVVYVDNDPVVLSHAKALLASGPDGATAYVDADLRDPGAILAAAAEVLDFSRPVAVMLVAILQHISDQDDPYGIVARLMAGVPSGSYLALSHPARDIQAARITGRSGGRSSEARRRLASARLSATAATPWAQPRWTPNPPLPLRRPDRGQSDRGLRRDADEKAPRAGRRLLDRQDDYRRFTRDFRVSPDNNATKRDIRMAKN